MSMIFILPESNGSFSMRGIIMKHPKDGSDCTFYLVPEQKTIFELNAQRNKFYSWFMNDNIVKDGSIYALTPIDPLFLLLPYIYKNCDRFQNLNDIFIENQISISDFECLYSPSILKCIADVKEFEDETFIKFSKERTLKWLSLKFENIKKSLIRNKIGNNLFGFKINNYNSGDSKLSDDEYSVLAFDMIADYFCEEFEKPLREKLGIPDKKELLASLEEEKKDGNKRKLEGDHMTRETPSADNDSADIRASSQAQNKKPKLTRAQVALNKVNRVGMKSITSYFQKKNA